MSVRSKNIHNKVYKFVHREDVYLVLSIKGCYYRSENGFIELTDKGILSIKGSCMDGYAWDGCTPKGELLDFSIGTPDGRLDYNTEKPITYYASMVHDVLYQHKQEIPISRKTTDLIFYSILKKSNFFWATIYYYFVRVAGWFFGKWKTKITHNNIEISECSWLK